MIKTYNSWLKLFLLCLGLAIAAAFCMKWMEKDLYHQGSLFTILGMEFSYSIEKLEWLSAGISPHVKALLRYLLYFDFIFMVGVFPGIASLCMIARYKTSIKIFRKLLYVMAALQTLAWGLDIFENLTLLTLLDTNNIDKEIYGWFHLAVWTKWVIAISAVLLSLPFIFQKIKK